jgi:cell division protein ZapA
VPQVTITINARQFRMACEDGQEVHLQQLAKYVDDRITALRDQFGQVGDARLTVMAALMVADELSETVNKVRLMEEELVDLRSAREIAADHAQATQAALVAAFTSAAERIEGAARKLNQSRSGGPGVAQS